MKGNFEKCLALTLKHEGGWADHPSDPGGATMKGITIGTYRAWKGRAVTKAELRAISDAEVAAIYRQNYWNVVTGDDLPVGLDFVAFDAAVNSGPSRGAKWLQEAIGACADGRIGPASIQRAHEVEPTAAINNACDLRFGFVRSLKTWGTFGRGWTSRIEDVRANALAMAMAATSRPGVDDTVPPPSVSAAAPGRVGIIGITMALGVAASALLGGR
ncbi:MAG: hypothetical protein FJX25_19150 [Alphaproteobacteria bacterium]|nr:hypothetical protein [Alphaproteobacteria bacterium]